MSTQRSRHLIILGHVWALTPFLPLMVLASPRDAPIIQHLEWYWLTAFVYLVGRTVLAWRDPRWLRWEYVFPPLDTLLVAVGLHMRSSIGGDSGTSIQYLYVFPIAEAASTLNVRWAAFIGLLSAVSGSVAMWGYVGIHGPVIFAFRLTVLVVMASLFTWIARQAADLRARLHVAADRNRIAMEMHDGVQAQLVAMAQQLELARRIAPTDGAGAAAIAAESRDLSRRAADDLRFLVYRLRASHPSEGFVPALQQYAHNMGSRSALPITVRVDGEPWPLGANAEHALFRIVQESLTNALKHAAAEQIEIDLRYGPAHVGCAVRDNGRGFDMDCIGDMEGHFGLGSMRDRAMQVGGDLSVESLPGLGTTVLVTLPRPAAARVANGEA